MNKFHEISGIWFEEDTMLVGIDGNRMRFDLRQVSEALLKASGAARNTWEISPTWYGIHWPLIDEDLSVDGLLGITHIPVKNVRSA